MFVMGMHCLGNASLSKVPTWVEIVSTLSPGILLRGALAVRSDAEPGGGVSKHTCNARLRPGQFGLSGSSQNYRVKRLSACGGCLGDYRR